MIRFILAVLLSFLVLSTACGKTLATIVPDPPPEPCESAKGFNRATYYTVAYNRTTTNEEATDTVVWSFSDEGVRYPKKKDFQCFHAIVDGTKIARTDRLEDDRLIFVFPAPIAKGPHQIYILGVVYSREKS
ncbi:MAG: hypothetical protein A3A27_01505 [Candidatus Wildermuthbacteria bacterium RIFCSPLOWO2_01_FULL_47_18]|uniref:Lipoprotein n=2 Tax=Candidatus Wildermuthiibacteriota TaxID=1817923 RepID=A0A1G2RGX8_9BACT|nr:MAG: hypothetical protein A3J68_01465 [Candidatus Wildermuthbacteria bacterium RIFCSPHIGHO2_02_FULL_48_16]OHA72085.1 MAG: hypothetical protein A3A27_01505 [Candidatus Wildermuthbacteria bacterium RIFCSPLOWO2_01_FULL_47_18]